MVGRCWKMILGGNGWQIFRGELLVSRKKIYPKKSSNRSGFQQAAPLLLLTFSFRALSSSLPTLAHRREKRTNLKPLYLVGSNRRRLNKTRPHRKTTKTLSDSFHPQCSSPGFFFWNPMCPEKRRQSQVAVRHVPPTLPDHKDHLDSWWFVVVQGWENPTPTHSTGQIFGDNLWIFVETAHPTLLSWLEMI